MTALLVRVDGVDVSMPTTLERLAKLRSLTAREIAALRDLAAGKLVNVLIARQGLPVFEVRRAAAVANAVRRP